MEKLPMCRICLADNVRMYIVVNRNLQQLYERLTDIPFITEDCRPMLACFFCCTKLKQCYRLLRKCLEAEELFAQMMNEDCKPLLNRDHLEFFGGFIKCPIVLISIVDECQTESNNIKEELPAVCEELDDIIEPKEEHQSEDQESQNLCNSCPDVANISPHHSESDLEDDVALMEFKTEVAEEQEVLKKKRSTREMKRAVVATKPKLDTRRTKLEDAVTAEQTRKDKSVSKVILKTQKRTSKPGPYFKEPYKCDQRRFNHVKKMMQHTRTQIGEKSFMCDVCQRSFNDKSNLRRHIRIHTGEKPIKCDVCQRSFSKKYNLISHIRIHTGEKPFKCDVCQCSFSHKGSLKNHIRIHTGEKPYKCEQQRTRTQIGEKSFMCDLCQRSFSEKSNLSRHIITIHTKPYKCDVCHRSFSEQESLFKHIRKHTGEKPYKCDVCQCSFSHKGSLKNHIRIHTGEKPYKCEQQRTRTQIGEKSFMCDLCQRSFSQKSNLSRHIITIHTKPYKCDVCHRSFSEQGSLLKHIRNHTGEKPFKCDVCQRGFSQRGPLSTHIRAHTGEKPYTFDVCQRSFSDLVKSTN